MTFEAEQLFNDTASEFEKQVLAAAKVWHGSQTDKFGEPYYLHLIGVYQMLSETATDAQRVAALLHDVLEDTTATSSELRSLGVSARSLLLIRVVTRDKSDGLTYLDWIRAIAGSSDFEAMEIKTADLKHNSLASRLAKLPESGESLKKRYDTALQILEQSQSRRINKTCQKTTR